MNKTGENDIAGVIAPPPLIFLAGIAIALVLEWAARADTNLGRLGLYVGLALIVVSIVIALWARRQFIKGGTSIRPDAPSSAILSTGPFRFTRNPLYLSLAMLQVGIGLAAGLAWVVAMVVPAVLVIRFDVIAREERYLERKFGEEYLNYKARVRRWFGPPS